MKLYISKQLYKDTDFRRKLRLRFQQLQIENPNFRDYPSFEVLTDELNLRIHDCTVEGECSITLLHLYHYASEVIIEHFKDKRNEKRRRKLLDDL